MTYDCIKCGGTGEIAAHKNVMGGVCFKCKGTGKQADKPHLPMKKFYCMFDGATVFTKSARTAEGARKMAIAHWKRFSYKPAFVNITDESQITVEEWAQ